MFFFQWEVVQRTLNGSQFYTYSVCNVGEREQDNWLRTTFIQRRPSASRVFVELQFIVRDCNSFDGSSMTCKETFNLFTSESDADVGTTFRKGQFKKVATIAPDEITSKNELRINTETKVVENLSRKGFYLAFQDIGACIALLSVRVFYKTCPATVKSLASFPETVAGGENQALREVSGVCVDNAISEELPRIYCTVDGEWVVPVGQCQCKPGYEEVKDACEGKGVLLNLWYLLIPPVTSSCLGVNPGFTPLPSVFSLQPFGIRQHLLFFQLPSVTPDHWCYYHCSLEFPPWLSWFLCNGRNAQVWLYMSRHHP